MKNMTLETIAAACGGEYHGDKNDTREASCVVIDSRKIEENGVFVAAKGERADGHDFIPMVKEKGALGVICETAPKDCDIPYILVKNSYKALMETAKYYRTLFPLPVIGITGSVGKTSTKEMVASVLSMKYNTLKTEGNFNNEIGLPLSVLRIRKEHEIAVLEMGISEFGEMRRLSLAAKPDICVMTNIGQSHLETLGSREGILRAKSEIFEHMNPGGTIFVNGDDDMLRGIQKKESRKVCCFGMEPSNEVYATDIVNKGLLGTEAVIHMGTEAFPLKILLPGTHMVYNALAAAAVGKSLGLTKEQIQEGIAKTEAVSGRSRVISLPSYTLLDDCYNANPVSMKAALDLLSMAVGRKVAILGDMFNLGEREKEFHREIGIYAAKKEMEVIICVGKLAADIYEGAKCANKKSEIDYFETKEELLDALKEILKPKDNILVKASHDMQFERIVEAFTAL